MEFVLHLIREVLRRGGVVDWVVACCAGASIAFALAHNTRVPFQRTTEVGPSRRLAHASALALFLLVVTVALRVTFLRDAVHTLATGSIPVPTSGVATEVARLLAEQFRLLGWAACLMLLSLPTVALALRSITTVARPGVVGGWPFWTATLLLLTPVVAALAYVGSLSLPSVPAGRMEKARLLQTVLLEAGTFLRHARWGVLGLLLLSLLVIAIRAARSERPTAPSPAFGLVVCLVGLVAFLATRPMALDARVPAALGAVTETRRPDSRPDSWPRPPPTAR